MAVIYKVTNTTGVDQFSIQEGTFDGPGGFQAHTNLQLHGYGYKHWGEKFDNNFYKLLENFACPESTTIPGTPQTEADLLGVGSGSGINHPVLGQLWFNTSTATKGLYVNNGTTWDHIATTASISSISYDKATADATFVKKAGDTIAGGLLITGGHITGYNPGGTYNPNLGPHFVFRAGTDEGGVGTTTNVVFGLGATNGIAANPHIDFHSSGGGNNGDSRIVASGGNPLAADQGNLTLTGNVYVTQHPPAGNVPTDNLKIATKYYVDTQAPAGFPSGTTLPFYQAAAPTGWTQNTTYNDYMLRVVNTVGGGSGGTDSPILNNKVSSHTHTFADSTSTTSASGAHTHNGVSGIGWVGRPPYGNSLTGSDTAGSGSEQAIGPGDFTAMSAAPTHTHTVAVSGTTATNAGALNWTPKYLNVIICSKN
jgi:hypothetical protein